MSWRTLVLGAAASLTALLAPTSPAWAQRGRAHVSAGHVDGRGYVAGSAHFSGRPAYGGAYYANRGYYRPYYGYYPSGFGYGLGLGYGLGVATSRSWYRPYYGWGYGAYPYYSGAYAYGPNYYVTPGYTSSYYGPSTAVEEDVTAAPATESPPRDDAAHLMVIVPAGAELWFDGKQTAQTGTEREFASPPLTPGRDYTYDVMARWTENGRPVEERRQIHVHSNMWAEIDLTKPEPPMPAATAPATTAPMPPAP